jgi:hypothetical protein
MKRALAELTDSVAVEQLSLDTFEFVKPVCSIFATKIDGKLRPSPDQAYRTKYGRTGCSLMSSIAATMRSLSSCGDATRMWRRKERASLDNHPTETDTPLHSLVAIDRNRWSRSIGISDHNPRVRASCGRAGPSRRRSLNRFLTPFRFAVSASANR